MTTFITQARFTKDGLNGMIAAPEDRAEIVGRLIAQVGGKLIAYYLWRIRHSADFRGTIVRGYGAGAYCCGRRERRCRLDALTSSEMKSAFVKAGPIAASYRSAAARAAGPSSAEPQTDLSNPGSQREGETAREAQDDVKAATAILNAEKKAVEDIRAGRPAPYFFAPPVSAASSHSTDSADAAKKGTSPTKGRRKGV